MGVDSGLPDFRGQTGFWNAYPAIARLGLSFAQMANPHWFQRDPRLAWAFYGHRLNLYRNTQPHDGFTQLLKMAATKPAGGFVFTSNVDGHFQKADWSEQQVAECHGSIHHLQCTRPCSPAIWSANGITLDIDPESFRVTGPMPTCPHCGALARPNILMFGDGNWIEHRSAQQEQRLHQWLTRLHTERQPLVILEIGAGHAVPTIRVNSESIAARHQALLIRINPRDHDLPHARHVALACNGAAGIKALWQKLHD
ncbi:MAG: NAD-dependent deacetylase [Magnetococcales bacterium]|nr:NAD-dependent deacetylase [Magnetococcales bacterium]NGZ04807.1 NAD-dependent deacetylase [Magnetococcales bacterium]